MAAEPGEADTSDAAMTAPSSTTTVNESLGVIPTSSTAAPNPVIPAMTTVAAEEACTAYEAELLRADGFLAENDDDLATAAFVDLVRPFGQERADALEAAFAIADQENSATVLALYDDFDVVTYEICGFPGVSALSAIVKAPTSQRFCAIGDSINSAVDDGDCHSEDVSWPNVLPCFEPTGRRFADFADPFAPVVCETGDAAAWDGAVWGPELARFVPVDEVIG